MLDAQSPPPSPTTMTGATYLLMAASGEAGGEGDENRKVRQRPTIRSTGSVDEVQGLAQHLAEAFSKVLLLTRNSTSSSSCSALCLNQHRHWYDCCCTRGVRYAVTYDRSWWCGDGGGTDLLYWTRSVSSSSSFLNLSFENHRSLHSTTRTCFLLSSLQ